MPLNGSGWQPNRCVRSVRFFGSALRTALVETDQGFGYLKGLGNPEGPHPLACELLGSELADWLGLPTLDYSLVEIQSGDEIPTSSNARVAPGRAFISKREELAFTWGGDAGTIEHIANVEAISQLVVIDTWIRNCDRHSPDGLRQNLDNVMLIKEPASRRAVRLVAMDFTHAFTCGHELTKKLSNIEYVRDARVYGLFDQFKLWLDRNVVRNCAVKMGAIQTADVTQLVNSIPNDWHVSTELRSHLVAHICERARFLADHIEGIIWEQMKFLEETENGD